MSQNETKKNLTPTQIQWFKNPYGLNEINQQTGFQFAFLSAPRDGLEQLHPWARCRDFLHDAVKCAYTETSCQIYGFQFNGKTQKLDLRRMRIMVSKIGLTKGGQAEQDFKEKILAGLRLVNHYEKMAGVSMSKAKKVYENNRPVWIINGPPFWLKAPVLVSMYTFLLRLGDKKLEFKDDTDLVTALKKLITSYKKADNDITYLKTVYDKLNIIIRNAEKMLFMGGKIDPLYVEKDITISMFHDRSGIVSFCQGNYPTKSSKRKQLITQTLKEGK